MKQINLSHLADKWPSSIIARSKVREFTGGMLSPGTMANLDCLGEGPTGRIKIGRNTGYLVDNFIDWLEQRAEA